MQAYSEPDRLTPMSRSGVPLPSTSWLPRTRRPAGGPLVAACAAPGAERSASNPAAAPPSSSSGTPRIASRRSVFDLRAGIRVLRVLYRATLRSPRLRSARHPHVAGGHISRGSGLIARSARVTDCVFAVKRIRGAEEDAHPLYS